MKRHKQRNYNRRYFGSAGLNPKDPKAIEAACAEHVAEPESTVGVTQFRPHLQPYQIWPLELQEAHERGEIERLAIRKGITARSAQLGGRGVSYLAAAMREIEAASGVQPTHVATRAEDGSVIVTKLNNVGSAARQAFGLAGVTDALRAADTMRRAEARVNWSSPDADPIADMNSAWSDHDGIGPIAEIEAHADEIRTEQREQFEYSASVRRANAGPSDWQWFTNEMVQAMQSAAGCPPARRSPVDTAAECLQEIDSQPDSDWEESSDVDIS